MTSDVYHRCQELKRANRLVSVHCVLIGTCGYGGAEERFARGVVVVVVVAVESDSYG